MGKKLVTIKNYSRTIVILLGVINLNYKGQNFFLHEAKKCIFQETVDREVKPHYVSRGAEAKQSPCKGISKEPALLNVERYREPSLKK